MKLKMLLKNNLLLKKLKQNLIFFYQQNMKVENYLSENHFLQIFTLNSLIVFKLIQLCYIYYNDIFSILIIIDLQSLYFGH